MTLILFIFSPQIVSHLFILILSTHSIRIRFSVLLTASRRRKTIHIHKQTKLEVSVLKKERLKNTMILSFAEHIIVVSVGGEDKRQFILQLVSK